VLASTGLVMFGRVGLAVIVVGATVMAVRSLMAGRRGADPLPGDDGGVSATETAWLAMRLDHGSGTMAGEVRRGRHAGAPLGALGLDDLRALLAELHREDPASAALLEAYLDRERDGWRAPGDAGAGPTGDPGAPLDEATALAILGLEPGADAAAIRAAHRRLMARFHPDQGGSTWLASRINAARDRLLRKRA
jgi:hypothetical protein